jgi:hypothetical protein
VPSSHTLKMQRCGFQDVPGGRIFALLISHFYFV